MRPFRSGQRRLERVRTAGALQPPDGAESRVRPAIRGLGMLLAGSTEIFDGQRQFIRLRRRSVLCDDFRFCVRLINAVLNAQIRSPRREEFCHVSSIS